MTQKERILMFRWSLTTAVAMFLFWTGWYLLFGEVPRVDSIKWNENISYQLPFTLSRWWYVLFAPVWVSLLIFIVFRIKEIPTDQVFYFSPGAVLGAGLVFGLVAGVVAAGLVFGLGASLDVILSIILGIGLIAILDANRLVFGLGVSIGVGLVFGLGVSIGVADPGVGLVATLVAALGVGLVASIVASLIASLRLIVKLFVYVFSRQTMVKVYNWLITKDIPQ